MAAITSTTNITDRRLAAYENVSPAQELCLTVYYDEEGWPIDFLFAVGQIVVSPSGGMYKIIGFTRSNEIIVAQYGLDMDKAISSLKLRSAEGLAHLDKPLCSSDL